MELEWNKGGLRGHKVELVRNKEVGRTAAEVSKTKTPVASTETRLVFARCGMFFFHFGGGGLANISKRGQQVWKVLSARFSLVSRLLPFQSSL